MKRWLLLLLLVLSSPVASPAADGESKLDAFARDVAKGEGARESRTETRLREEPFDDLFGGFLGEVFVGGLWYGGVGSLGRIQEDPAEEFLDGEYARAAGEPLIPFLRLDADMQRIDPGLDAWNVAAECGYGPIAVWGRMQRFDGDDPDARMDLYEVALLYRLSFGRHVEIDLGGGTVQLDGVADASRGSFLAELRVHPHEWFGLEFRTTLAQELEIYDVALLAGPRFVDFKAGWRWTRSPNESLDGPYAGMAISF